MEKSKIFRFLAYFTIILTLLSLLPGVSFAAKDYSEHGKGNQDMREDVRNSSNNKTDEAADFNDSVSGKERLQNNISAKDQSKSSDNKQEKKRLKEEVQSHKQEYREAKGEFLRIRSLVRAGKLDPNSEEALNATRLYLNSSIDYMIAHLSSVKSNMAYSNGNGTAEKITGINEKIRLLEVEKGQVANASSQEELVVVVSSVRRVWNNAEKTSVEGAGQIVSENIGEFLEKSENLSEKLGAKIENLNKTGVNTTELETELASYDFYINSAQENKEAADSIYSSENVTKEDMEKANNYLRQSLSDINKANDIIRQILDKLRKYEIEKGNETGVESSQKTALNTTENATGRNNHTGNLTEELHN